MASLFKTFKTLSTSKQEDEKEIKRKFLQPNLLKDGKFVYLKMIHEVVKSHFNLQIVLKTTPPAKQEKYILRIGSFEDSKQHPGMLEECEQYYQPDEMKMQVFGVVEKFPCNNADHLVLMVCEDGKVFGYEEEKLHVVADNLEELFKSGFQFPGTEQFYRGQSFEDMTDDEWEDLKNESSMMKEHEELLKNEEHSYLQSLKRIMKQDDLHPQMGGAAKEIVAVAAV